MTTLSETSRAFLEKHNMNYDVQKLPSAFKNPDGTYTDVPEQFHLVRSSDNAAIDPSTVKGGYAPMTPMQMIAPLDPLVAEGWITPDCGHIFKGGSYEVITFRIDGGQLDDGGNIAGESWTHYVSVHNHQGGGGKLKGSIHSHRIVCTNTAVRAARMASFGIRHTGEIQQNYEWAIQTWKKLQEEIRQISKRMEVFASKQVSPTDSVEILRTIYGVNNVPVADISTRTANELQFAVREFSNPQRGTRGQSLADVYNAITATNSHYSPKGSKETSEKRLASLFDEQGSRNKLELDAMNVLLDLAGIAD